MLNLNSINDYSFDMLFNNQHIMKEHINMDL